MLTAIYVSSKRCEVNKLKITDVLSMTEESYLAGEIVEIESEMLHIVDFNLEFETNLGTFFWEEN